MCRLEPILTQFGGNSDIIDELGNYLLAGPLIVGEFSFNCK